MPPRKSRRRTHSTTIHLTIAERDMLLAFADGDAVFDVLTVARVHGPLVCLELRDGELTEFLDAFERTSNSAQSLEAMDRLGEAFARIDDGLAGNADPGTHMLRPAFSRLDVSQKQGQYLAFIHTYTRLHRRPPAESEIEEYFRTTAPAVHEMLATLQRRKLISRSAGVARSIRLLLAPHEIPELE